MTEPRSVLPSRNGWGWVILAIGVVFTTIGVIAWTAMWDVRPEEASSRLLIGFPLIGLTSIGIGLYALITRKPLNDEVIRYPYGPGNQRWAARKRERAEDERAERERDTPDPTL